MRALVAASVVLLSAPLAHAGDLPTEAYALPFELRPAVAQNLARIDLGGAFSQPLVGTSTANATVLTSRATVGGVVVPELGVYARFTFVHNQSNVGDSANAISNPQVFALYSKEIAPHLRLPLFVGLTAPIGSGGGDDPVKSRRAAVLAGGYARQAMDNELFATNELTPSLGAGLAWMDQGLTVQGEATVSFFRRVRGAEIEPDSARTSATIGLSVGYLALPPILSLNLELHYQRWLTTPQLVQNDEDRPSGDQLGLRDQLTLGGGVRANFSLGAKRFLRPGLGYFRGVDKPMSEAKYSIVQLDVPFVF